MSWHSDFVSNGKPTPTNSSSSSSKQFTSSQQYETEPKSGSLTNPYSRLPPINPNTNSSSSASSPSPYSNQYFTQPVVHSSSASHLNNNATTTGGPTVTYYNPYLIAASHHSSSSPSFDATTNNYSPNRTAAGGAVYQSSPSYPVNTAYNTYPTSNYTYTKSNSGAYGHQTPGYTAAEHHSPGGFYITQQQQSPPMATTAGGNQYSSTSDSLVYKIIELINSLNLKLIAFDFDCTIVTIHTGGQWMDSPEKLAEFVRPCFRELIPALLKCHNLFVCVVTYSPQEELIRDVLRISMKDEFGM